MNQRLHVLLALAAVSAPGAAAADPAAPAAPAPSATAPAPAAPAPSATPTPAAPAPSAPAASASATASVSVPEPAPSASAAASVPASPKEEPAVVVQSSSAFSSDADAEDVERRLVVFTDGGAPRLVAYGNHGVHGPLELEVRFRNANPLCYEYSTNVAASHIAASDQPLPDRVPGIGAFGAPAITNFMSLEDALAAVNHAQTELDDILNAARIQVSLDDVWAACDGGGDFASERARVETAARVAAQRLGPFGAWRGALENAESVSLGAKRLARELEGGEHEAAQDVEAKKTALAEADKKEREMREQAQRTGKTKKVQAELDEAARDLAAAQRRLRESELVFGRHHRAADLGHAGERLAERVRHSLETLSTAIADINRARSLLARSPTAIRRRFGAGETVRVEVERIRLERGERVAGRGPQLFSVAPYRTLRPIIMDLGIGPALGVGSNTVKYETRYSPKSKDDPYAAWRVVRTEEGVPLDLMASLSMYIWERRYLDDTVIDGMQFIPRPMIGISLAHPLSEFYAGLQVDPIKFVDLSAGVRVSNEDRLIGPAQLDHALVDANGNPQPPLTRKEMTPSAFISVTLSTNIFYQWLGSGH